MMAQCGAKGVFPRQDNQGRQMGPQNQGYKAEVNEVTHMENKTTSEVSASQPRSTFCKIHRFDNHDTEKCTDVRATINKMVENRCRHTGEVRWDSLLSHEL
ncbi:hypothetical protein Adt_03656 [Abeliophyllum distichum]|uniref:Uncharacterized protein n=1 Tax=Abeliophyllum distichum TaxID=126358 RepID=A0ABD1W175_9LAMI